MSLGGSASSSDAVELIQSDSNGKIKRVVSTFNKTVTVENMRFCPDCGEKLVEIPLYTCEICGNRYVARIEPQTGKTIIFALGKDTVRENQQ